MKRNETASGKKLEYLQNLRKENLIKELRKVSEKIYINREGIADLNINYGKWITDEIRKAVVLHNWKMTKIPKLQIRDYDSRDILYYEEHIQ